MNQKALRVLEYNKIIDQLASCASSALAKDKCLNLKPSSDREEVKAWQNETTEAVNMVLQYGNLPMGPIFNLDEGIKLANIGSVLSPKQLLQVADSVRTARIVKKHIGQAIEKEAQFQTIMTLGSQLTTHQPLEKSIEKCIVSESEISDHASNELFKIRRSMESKKAAIRQKLESMITSSTYQKYLQDTIITIRQDRLVLPVKSEHKNHVKGMVHDQSATGSTFYIEPMAVVELNNQLATLKLQEQKEIERILRILSGQVAEVGDAILENIDLLTLLDFIFAKAKFSFQLKGMSPELNDQRYVRLKNARHPLLNVEEVVPSNIWIGDAFNTLLITGPNTGGKTVTLKTLGLMTLMAQAGLHLPVDYGSSIAVFDEVYADIGDEQSIEQSLSTFSSHMTNIVSILNDVTPNCLVLFDELGAGTDPTEGAALAMAILDRLRKMKVRTVATTHYSELKEYAIVTDEVENASVEFDVETLSPTYRLLIGVPGKSNAFEISKKLGLNLDVINEAKAYVHQDNIEFEDILSNIEANQKMAEQAKDDAVKMKQDIEKLKNRLKEKEDKLDGQRDKIVKNARQDAKEILKKAKDEADTIVKELRGIKKNANQDKNKEIEAMRRQLSKSIDDVTEKTIDYHAENRYAPKDLNVGDGVRVLSINQEGTVVTKPNSKGELTVQVGLMKMNVNLKGLEKINKKKKDEKLYEKVRTFNAAAATIKTELDVRGSNVEDAIMEIDKYLDNAALANFDKVRIIHGKGTGQLRKGLHEHFKGHHHIKHFELAAYNEGGSGATVIEIK